MVAYRLSNLNVDPFFGACHSRSDAQERPRNGMQWPENQRKPASRFCGRANRYSKRKRRDVPLAEGNSRQDLRLGFKLMIVVAGERSSMDPQPGLPGDEVWLDTGELHQ